MIEARNLWELLEKRVEATPDAVMAVDENGRALTFAEYKAEAERAAAGLARLGIGAGDVVSWQLPTWLESIVLVAALSRLGAVQNPMLPIYRQREVGFITKQAGSRLLVVPGTWRNFDYEEMATRDRRRTARPRDPRRQPGAAAGRSAAAAAAARTRPTTPPTCRCAGTTTRPARRRTRRARSTPMRRSAPPRSACASGSRSPSPTASVACSRSPTSPAPCTSSVRSRSAAR